MVECSGMPVGGWTDALFTEVYERLKAMASRRLAGQRRNGTLDTTELVHELYLRMGDRPSLRFQEPTQFFAYAAHAMRHLLINRARDRLRLRAGGQWNRVTLDERGPTGHRNRGAGTGARRGARCAGAGRRPRGQGRRVALFRGTEPGAGCRKIGTGASHDRPRLAFRARVHQGTA